MPLEGRIHMAAVLQLKILLKEIKPLIWRRFLVEGRLTFHQLHEVIQVVMGWENYHLYEFPFKQFHFGIPENKHDTEYEDARKAHLKDFLEKEKQKLNYLYDFGDGWEHFLVIEKTMEKANGKKCPVCLDGARACPPEDCGGIPGYYEALKALKDKKNPKNEELLDWLGDYDPEAFSLQQINKRLASKKFS